MSDRPAETEYSALEALMQIRSNNGNNQGESRIPTEIQGAKNDAAASNAARVAAATAAANSNVNLSNFLRMNASPASYLQQAQLTYSPGQLTAAAAASLNPAPGAFGRGSLLSAVLQNPAYATPGAASPYRGPVARVPPLVTAVSSTTMNMPLRSTTLSPLLPAGHEHTPTRGVAAQESNIQKNQAELDSSADASIRKGEVEAALRSKPQRGRKRENLNAEERLELTRTRNREHAKSTRIRKKARYQELLDREQKFLEHQEEEELDLKRRQAVLTFLHVRALMLNGTLEASSKSRAEQDSSRQTIKSEEEIRQSSVSFDHSHRAGVKTDSGDEASLGSTNRSSMEEAASRLSELLVNRESFRFETSLGESDGIDGITSMRLFDQDLVRRFEGQYGGKSCSETSYNAVGSDYGVALSQDGSGFAKVELMAEIADESHPTGADAPAGRSKQERKLLFTSVVSFQFAAKSPKLSNASWCILRDVIGNSPCSSGNGGRSESTAAREESLESQTVYPSVVSFDDPHRGKARDGLLHSSNQEQSTVQEQHGEQMEDTGMNI